MNEYVEILDRRISVFFLYRKETLSARFKMRVQYFMTFIYFVLSVLAIYETLISTHLYFYVKLIALIFMFLVLPLWIALQIFKIKERRSTYFFLKEKTINMFAGIFEMRGILSSKESKVVLNYLDEKLLLVSAKV